MIADEGDDPQAADAKAADLRCSAFADREQFRQCARACRTRRRWTRARSIWSLARARWTARPRSPPIWPPVWHSTGARSCWWIQLPPAGIAPPVWLANGKGFSDVLNGTGNFEEAVHPTHIPNLSVMTSGPSR